MILAILSKCSENDRLCEELKDRYGEIERTTSVELSKLQNIAEGQYSCLIIDCSCTSLENPVTFQAILGVSNIVPSVYFNVRKFLSKGETLSKPAHAAFCNESTFTCIYEHIELLTAQHGRSKRPSPRVIPNFDRRYAAHFLQAEQAICVLAVDASSFKSIEARYGAQAYHEAQKFLQDLLIDLWGRTGNFRSKDILCRYSEEDNIYLIILEPNRSSGNLPAPGCLEVIADRVQIQIDNTLWSSLRSRKGERCLPSGMTVIPDIHIGYASATSSPFEDEKKIIDHLVSESLKTIRLQEKRLSIRRREYMQNIICTPNALMPVYQGVFHLDQVTQEQVQEANAQKSIAPLRAHVFGFESLIRAQKDIISRVLGASKNISVDPQLLTPDVMFSIAKAVNISLELDMISLRQAVKHAGDLPGKLMINILPRNFYNLRKMKKLFPEGLEPVFEVSESEAIENFDLVCEVRADLKQMNFGVATDDFGKDYGGLERIFKIQPDIIKLDRALISNIHKDPPRLAFLSGLVQSAKISNSMTLAEGVECWEEAESLQKIGVELVQGYLFHRPQEVNGLIAEIRRGEAAQDDAEGKRKVIPLKVG